MPKGKRYILVFILLASFIFFLLLLNIFSGNISADSEFLSSHYSSDIFSSLQENDKNSFLQYKYDSNYDYTIYQDLSKEYSDVTLPYSYGDDKNYLSQTLFIGDSNTAGLSSFGYMPLQNVLAKPSMAIQSVRTKKFVYFRGYNDVFNIIQAVEMLKPRRIVINFGTNNTVGTSASEFIKYYKLTLRDIQNAYPYADIIVASVLPVGKIRENIYIKMQVVDDFNLLLMQLCREEGYRFLNTCEIFKNSDTGFMQSKFVANDGIHLNHSGFLALLNYLETHQYVTQDERPPRGNIPVRVTEPNIADTPVPEIPTEPGEEQVIRPPVIPESTPLISSNSSPAPTSSNGVFPPPNDNSSDVGIDSPPFENPTHTPQIVPNDRQDEDDFDFSDQEDDNIIYDPFS